MPNDYIGFRIDAETKEKLQEIANNNDENVSDTIKRALSEFMAGDTSKPDIQALAVRLNRLEQKYEKLAQSEGKQRSQKVNKEDPEPDNQEKINTDDLGELITIKEAAQLTGYAVNTLRSNFSRVAISAQDQVSGNRAGLYSKKEIINKIGFK